MAVICPDAGLLFVLSPRTGSTAVADGVLVPHLGGRMVPPEHVYDADGNILINAKHSTLPQLIEHGIISPAQREGLLAFTTVRNPFDSLVSLYLKQRHDYRPLLDDPGSWVHAVPAYRRQMELAARTSFSNWLRRREPVRRRGRRLVASMLRRRGPHHLYRGHLSDVDVVLRFEHLQEDFDALLDRVGLAPIELPIVNRTESRDDHGYRGYYDPRARRYVERHYAGDLERFGYRF